MADYKRRDGFGGSGRGNRDERGGFNKGGGDRGFRYGNRDGGRKEMFSAICASCGKSCEVPFRPTQGKPVYCNNCFREGRGSSGNFVQRDNKGGGSRDFQRKDFSSHQTSDRRIDDIKRQLDEMEIKLNKIMRMLGNGESEVSREMQRPKKKTDKTSLKTIVEDTLTTDKKPKKDKKKAKKKTASKKK